MLQLPSYFLVFLLKIQPWPKPIIFWKSLPEAPTHTDSALSASTRLLQHLPSPESTERAVWIRYALRAMVSFLAQMVFWHARLTGVKTWHQLLKAAVTSSEQEVQGLCLSWMQKREKTSDSRRPFSTLRSDAHTHFLSDLFAKGISFVASTFLGVYYMWILFSGPWETPCSSKGKIPIL